MRLLFYIHAITGGGGERVLATLVNEFINQGDEVHLATNLDIPFTYDVDSKVKLHHLLGRQKISNSKFLRPLMLRYYIRKIAKHVRPDIIVAFMTGLGCSVLFSTIGLGIPVVVSEHTNVSRVHSRGLNFKRTLLYPLASAVTVLTRYDSEQWKTKFRNIVYMPNPVDTVSFYKCRQPRRKVVLAVGRVNQWKVKGFDNLLKCWSQICHDYPDWKLEIAGAADQRSKSYLIDLANEYNCTNYEFVGFRSDIQQLMMQSEVFCLSSRTEGLPMALLEAMSLGCCCVSFDVITGPREIIVHGQSGLIADNQNNDDLVNQLRLVIGDESYRHYLSDNAPLSVMRYSTDRIIKRWKILFNKILN